MLELNTYSLHSFVALLMGASPFVPAAFEVTFFRPPRSVTQGTLRVPFHILIVLVWFVLII